MTMKQVFHLFNRKKDEMEECVFEAKEMPAPSLPPPSTTAEEALE